MTPQQNANQARADDLAWMADHYETPREAARRLGLSLGGLVKWCARYDPEVLDRLRLNEARRKGMVA